MGAQQSSESVHISAPNSNTPKGTDATYHVEHMLKTIPEYIQFTFDKNPPEIKKEIIPVEGNVFVLHNVLTAAECQQFIHMATEMGFAQSPLRDLSYLNADTAQLTSRTLEIRNSERVLCDMIPEINEELCRRIEPFLPQQVDCKGYTWEVLRVGEMPAGGCVNSRWRFNRYQKGGYFRPHYDAGYKYSNECETIFTFILYLNEGFEGGETTFFSGNTKNGSRVPVTPTTGSALIFFQTGPTNPLHEGSELLSDEPSKFILHSDLAYRKM